MIKWDTIGLKMVDIHCHEYNLFRIVIITIKNEQQQHFNFTLVNYCIFKPSFFQYQIPNEKLRKFSIKRNNIKVKQEKSA